MPTLSERIEALIAAGRLTSGDRLPGAPTRRQTDAAFHADQVRIAASEHLLFVSAACRHRGRRRAGQAHDTSASSNQDHERNGIMIDLIDHQPSIIAKAAAGFLASCPIPSMMAPFRSVIGWRIAMGPRSSERLDGAQGYSRSRGCAMP
jgi:hypothetical protein